jgi:hypothetical protein
MRVESRLTIRPSAQRSKPSQQSLLRRRNTSVGTVVWVKTMERRVGGRCRSPQRKDALVPTSPSARAIRTATPSAGAHGSSVRQAVPFSGCLGKTDLRGAGAPWIPASPGASASRLCASESAAEPEKSSGAVESSARSARWARALRGSATPRIARDFLGPKPDWSLVPDPAQENASSPVIAKRRRSIRRSRGGRKNSTRRLGTNPRVGASFPAASSRDGEWGEGFFRLLAWPRPKPRPPASSPKTRRWVRARGKGPDAVT